MSTAIAEHIDCPQCEARLRVSDTLRPSFCLQCRFPVMLVADKYQLVSVLGEGGFGTVYEANHIRLTRDPRRVVKVLKPELLEEATMRERFAREVQVTSALSQRNHHIVRVYDDFGEIPNLGLFYVMEYLEGQPLSALLKESQELLPLERCFHFFEQLCLAMHDAHQEGIIHRDLKPDNIVIVKHLRDEDHLKVIDFGIARPTEPNQKITNFSQGMLGTPAYMAPEQLSQQIGEHVDIYAMGVILFELLVGHTPFATSHGSPRSPAEVIAAKLMETPPRVDHVAPPGREISSAIVEVVATALARSPDERFATVEALERAFQQARQEPRIPDFSGNETLDDSDLLGDPSQTQDIIGSHASHDEEHAADEADFNPYSTLPYAITLEGLLEETPTSAVALRPAISDTGLPFQPEGANTLSQKPQGQTPDHKAPITHTAPATPAANAKSERTKPALTESATQQAVAAIAKSVNQAARSSSGCIDDDPSLPSSDDALSRSNSNDRLAFAPTITLPVSPQLAAAPASSVSAPPASASLTPAPHDPNDPAILTPTPKATRPAAPAPTHITPATPTPPTRQQITAHEDDQDVLILSAEHRISATPGEQVPLTALPVKPPVDKHDLPASAVSTDEWYSMQSVDIDPDMFERTETGPRSTHSTQKETKAQTRALLLLLCVLGLLGYIALHFFRLEGVLPSGHDAKKKHPPAPSPLITPKEHSLTGLEVRRSALVSPDTREPLAQHKQAVRAVLARKPRRRKPRRRPRRRKPKRKKVAAGHFAPRCPQDRKYRWLRLQIAGAKPRDLLVAGHPHLKQIRDKRGFCLGSRTGKAKIVITGRKPHTFIKCNISFQTYRPYRVIRMQRAKGLTIIAPNYCAHR